MEDLESDQSYATRNNKYPGANDKPDTSWMDEYIDWHHKSAFSKYKCTCDERTLCQHPKEDKEDGVGCTCSCHYEEE